MLSIIVSSCDPSHLSNLRRSVEETIDTEHEIVVIENNDAKFSLTEAYNLGASRANYPFLLFVHEDVIFKTQGWGKLLIDHLESLENAGIVGVAGTTYKPYVPSGWSFDRTRPLSFHLIQGHKYANQLTNLTAVNNDSIRKVVALDGVFLAVRRDVLEKVHFDESVKGFHGYDMDYSLAVAEQYQNYFVPDILIEHRSEGKISDQWITNTFRINEKWQGKLPMSVEKNGLDLESELSAYHTFVKILFESTLAWNVKARYLGKTTYRAVKKTRSPKFAKAFLYSVRQGLLKTRGTV
jgi:GT2 family glycosyltransferase